MTTLDEVAALRTAARRYVAAWRGLDVELDDDAEEAGEQFAARVADYRDTLAALVAAVDALDAVLALFAPGAEGEETP